MMSRLGELIDWLLVSLFNANFLTVKANHLFPRGGRQAPNNWDAGFFC